MLGLARLLQALEVPSGPWWTSNGNMHSQSCSTIARNGAHAPLPSSAATPLKLLTWDQQLGIASIPAAFMPTLLGVARGLSNDIHVTPVADQDLLELSDCGDVLLQDLVRLP